MMIMCTERGSIIIEATILAPMIRSTFRYINPYDSTQVSNMALLDTIQTATHDLNLKNIV